MVNSMIISPLKRQRPAEKLYVVETGTSLESRKQLLNYISEITHKNANELTIAVATPERIDERDWQKHGDNWELHPNSPAHSKSKWAKSYAEEPASMLPLSAYEIPKNFRESIGLYDSRSYAVAQGIVSPDEYKNVVIIPTVQFKRKKGGELKDERARMGLPQESALSV